jgi:DNA-binding transcriptional LysR family regulator
VRRPGAAASGVDRWLGVELRHLAAFRAVAEEASFNRAATRLGYTQSAVSQQVAALERILDERLFERLKGAAGVTLTEAGKVLFRHTRDLGALLASAQADMEAFSAGALGSLRVGTFQTPGARILPEILSEFFALRPRTEVRLRESVTDHGLLDELEQGELDLAFAALPVRDGPFVVTPLVEDPFLLLARGGLPAGPDGCLPPARRRVRLPLVTFASCPAAEAAIEYLRGLGYEPDLRLRSDHNETLQRAAGLGLGAALVPRLSLVPGEDGLEQVVLPPDAPKREIVLVWRSDRGPAPAARIFAELAERVCGRLANGRDLAA